MINIISAPRIHSQKAESNTKHIVKYLKTKNKEYSVYFSYDFDDLTKNVKELISFGETDLIVVGDDETLNYVINSIKDISKIKLGIIPIGDNDDFASFLGLPMNLTEAVDVILKGDTTDIDFLVLNDMRVLNSIVFGSNVEIAEKYKNFKIKNKLMKKVADIKYAKDHMSKNFRITSKNNRAIEGEITDLIIANGGLCQSRKISPLSNVSDGLFNVSIIKDDEQIKTNIFSKLNKGEHIYDSHTKQKWLNNIKVECNEKVKFLVDNRIMAFDVLDVMLIEKGLKIFKS